MEIGDAFIGVNHGQLRTFVIGGLEICFDGPTLVARECCNFGVNITQTIVGIYP